jgi:hypothetical protein
MRLKKPRRILPNVNTPQGTNSKFEQREKYAPYYSIAFWDEHLVLLNRCMATDGNISFSKILFGDFSMHVNAALD